MRCSVFSPFCLNTLDSDPSVPYGFSICWIFFLPSCCSVNSSLLGLTTEYNIFSTCFAGLLMADIRVIKQMGHQWEWKIAFLHQLYCIYSFYWTGYCGRYRPACHSIQYIDLYTRDGLWMRLKMTSYFIVFLYNGDHALSLELWILCYFWSSGNFFMAVVTIEGQSLPNWKLFVQPTNFSHIHNTQRNQQIVQISVLFEAETPPSERQIKKDKFILRFQ